MLTDIQYRILKKISPGPRLLQRLHLRRQVNDPLPKFVPNETEVFG